MYKKYFTVSFDDGLEQDKRLIAMMKKYGIKGTFNLNGGMFGEKGSIKRIGNLAYKNCPPGMVSGKIFKYSPYNRIPEDEIRQVYEGMEIASHAYKHEALGKLPKEKVQESLERDIQALESIVGHPILGHAYAYGSTSKEVESCLKEKGIIYARAVRSGQGFSFPENTLNLCPTCSQISKNVFELLDQFIHAKADKEDLLFYMWGHGYECDFGSREASWEKTERIFQTIAYKDDINYSNFPQLKWDSHLEKSIL